MFKKFCDRCGKLIPVDEDALTKYTIHHNAPSEDEPFIHLCPKCETAFEIWMNPTLEPWACSGKEIKAEQEQWVKEKKEMAKKQDEYDEVAEFENAYNIVIKTLIKNGMMACDVDEIDMMMDQYWPKKEEPNDKNRT